MNWKKYEDEILKHLSYFFPETDIKKNQKIVGRYSKVERQIDVLIEDYVAGNNIKIIIDGKYYSKHLNVKDVESFLGMIKDLGADKGILITEKGYSEAAINRAYNDPSRLELDILNFKELKEFQGYEAIPYVLNFGVIAASPFGWIVDSTKNDSFLASFYQRGLTLQEAIDKKEFIYLNIEKKSERIKSLDDLIKVQEDNVKRQYPEANFEYFSTIRRKDATTKLRLITGDKLYADEYTGFVDFENYIVFCVLNTKPELVEKNRKKLEYIIQKIIPIKINSEAELKTSINELEKELSTIDSNEQKSGIIAEQAKLYILLEDYATAEQKLKDSIDLFDQCYPAKLTMIDLKLIMGKDVNDVYEQIEVFVDLDPTNPKVCQDILDSHLYYNKEDDLPEVFKRLLDKFNNNSEVLGNLKFHLAEYYYNESDLQKAKDLNKEALKEFEKCLPSDHHVFEAIEERSKVLEEEIRRG